jgi:putative membrane protein
MRFLLRLLINAAALWVAVQVVGGIQYRGSLVALLGVALIFGAINAILKPVLTLGLFTIVVNAILLLVTSSLSGAFGLDFHVTGFGAAFLGAIVVSIVSLVLSMVID